MARKIKYLLAPLCEVDRVPLRGGAGHDPRLLPGFSESHPVCLCFVRRLPQHGEPSCEWQTAWFVSVMASQMLLHQAFSFSLV